MGVVRLERRQAYADLPPHAGIEGRDDLVYLALHATIKIGVGQTTWRREYALDDHLGGSGRGRPGSRRSIGGRGQCGCRGRAQAAEGAGKAVFWRRVLGALSWGDEFGGGGRSVVWRGCWREYWRGCGAGKVILAGVTPEFGGVRSFGAAARLTDAPWLFHQPFARIGGVIDLQIFISGDLHFDGNMILGELAGLGE